MVIKTPQFSDFRILRREMLESLSDYAFSFGQLLYEGYADGILSGCRLVTTESEIQVRPGIIVLGGKLYLINEPLSVPYYPTDTLCICKFRFMNEYRADNFVYRDMELVLCDETDDCKQGIELCRFKLQPGARLRYKYDDFEDRSTVYDTLNTIYAPYSCYGGSSLSPDILHAFCRELCAYSNNAVDTAFCMQALNSTHSIHHESIDLFLKMRRGSCGDALNNDSTYQQLLSLLKSVRQGEEPAAKPVKKMRRRLDLD